MAIVELVRGLVERIAEEYRLGGVSATRLSDGYRFSTDGKWFVVIVKPDGEGAEIYVEATVCDPESAECDGVEKELREEGFETFYDDRLGYIVASAKKYFPGARPGEVEEWLGNVAASLAGIAV